MRARFFFRFFLPLIVACGVLTACGGKPRAYSLKTCIVCDQALGGQASPIEFVYEDQQIKSCSETDHQKFLQEPEKYMKKVAEVKVL